LLISELASEGTGLEGGSEFVVKTLRTEDIPPLPADLSCPFAELALSADRRQHDPELPDVREIHRWLRDAAGSSLRLMLESRRSQLGC